MKRNASLCVFFAMLVWLTPLASAQETGASIEGVVKDTSGGVLPGVTVEARTGAGAVVTAVPMTRASTGSRP